MNPWVQVKIIYDFSVLLSDKINLIKKLFQYLSLIAVCLLCYGPTSTSRDAQFVFDDFVAIVRNTDVTNVKRPILHAIQRIFAHDFWGTNITDPTSHKSYRPLITLTFNLEYRFYNDKDIVVNMKTANLLIHVMVCCIMLHMSKTILDSINDTNLWMSSVLFAIHPIHTEAVCGIVGRAELLCTMFYLLTIEMYLVILNGEENLC